MSNYFYYFYFETTDSALAGYRYINIELITGNSYEYQA